MAARIESTVALLGVVPAAAAPAHAAPRQVLQALARSVRLRATHAARMFPPSQSAPFLERVDAAVRRGAVTALGWTEEEADAAWPQCGLAQKDRGMGLRPITAEAPFLHLSAWLLATASGRLGVPRETDPAAHWGDAQGARGRRLRALYHECRAQDRALPERLCELGEHAAAVAPRRRRARTEPDDPGSAPWALRWATVLTAGLDDARLRAWRAKATPEQRTLRDALGNGRWALQEPPDLSRYTRTEWLIAMRLWHGLDIWPGVPDGEVCARTYQNRYVVSHADGTRSMGETCRSCPGGRRRGRQADRVPTPLDSKGRHALVCKVGGGAVARHDYIRDALGSALRRLVSGVRWERYLPDLVRVDGAEKSRLWTSWSGTPCTRLSSTSWSSTQCSLVAGSSTGTACTSA